MTDAPDFSLEDICREGLITPAGTEPACRSPVLSVSSCSSPAPSAATTYQTQLSRRLPGSTAVPGPGIR